jgi:hypothetical protein
MINYSQDYINLNNDKFKVVINQFLSADFNHIFNEIDFFKLHSTSNADKYFQLIRISDNKVFATITFFLNNHNQYLSPVRGTFGGISALDSVDFSLLEEFLTIAVNELLLRNSSMIKIKLQPLSHNPQLFSVCSNIFSRLNFSITSYDLNYSLEINNEVFLSKLSYGNQKKLKQCLKDGFFASKLDISRFKEAYKVIQSNRESKGYPMTMDQSDFLEMVKIFPNNIHCFAVFNPNDLSMIASSICISINSDILYVFYWGDLPSSDSYSPITLLSSYIYDFAKENSYKIIDVGTSTINGEPNYGLINFKRNLGFEESLKLTLEFRGEGA